MTVYDRWDRVGGLLIYGIPNFKLEKDVVLRRRDLCEQSGIRFEPNFAVGRGCGVCRAAERHDAVLVATGVYRARELGGPGVGLPGIVPALDYLIASNRENLGDAVPDFASGLLDARGKNVVVIGGGDTAMDCVRTAVRQGAKTVKCLYRRDRANMPGSMREVKNAEDEGVEFVWLSAPEAFTGRDKVTGVRAVRMHLGLPDATGRQTVEPIEGGHFTVKADLVIKALGFDPEDLPVMFNEPGLAVTRWGTLKVNHRTFMTSLPGVFAAGDIVRGASLVVWAIRDGRDAAAQIMRGWSSGRRCRWRRNSGGRGDDQFQSKPLTTSLLPGMPTRPPASHYDPSQEHDSCGVGFVAALDGETRRDVVQAGIDALKAVWHRGAVDADGKTGDGAGIHVEIPQDFFAAAVQRGGAKLMPGRSRWGMVFLPKTDLGAQERCRQIVETEILNFGYLIYGWRQVPINVDCIGEKANATRPEIEQIMLWNPKGATGEFERDLYVIRRRIEKQAIGAQIPELYFCSLSCRSIIYKGMFLAEHLAEFYPDLLDPRFVSRFAIYHQRYSTNTFPTWRLAQPFRMLAHNGEINTLTGNINWMKSHETRLSADELGPYHGRCEAGGAGRRIGYRDTRQRVRADVRAGRDAPMAKALMIPAASARTPRCSRRIATCPVLQRGDGAVGRAGRDRRDRRALGDRRTGPNGLRPMRYTITSDAMLIVGSETGMVKLDGDKIIEKGRVGPGQTIAVDLEHARSIVTRN